MPATATQQRKVGKVMHEFKEGKLRSSSGDKVTKRKQAVAIALSESGQSREQRKPGKAKPAAKSSSAKTKSGTSRPAAKTKSGTSSKSGTKGKPGAKTAPARGRAAARKSAAKR